MRSCGSDLPAGHAVGEVVIADDHDVHVAARRVDEVVAADTGEVALAAEYHHFRVRSGQLESGCNGNGASMRRVNGIEIDVARNTAGTADAGNHRQFVGINTAALDRFGKRIHFGADTAPGTPDMRHAVHAQGTRHGAVLLELSDIRTHLFPFLIASRITSGSCTAPPQWLTLITLLLPPAQRSTSLTIWP